MLAMAESPRDPKAALARHGLAPKKHFGQNFLADENLVARIAELCTTPPGGTVLELGAGLGALTRPLLERASRVIAVERDRDLVPALAADHADAIASQKLTILEADAKRIDVDALFRDTPSPHVLAGNLPYQITGPLLEMTVGVARRIDRAVYLVQLEVADRIVAAPNSENYGALSVFIQAAFSATRAFIVRRGAFHPQPGVDSAVLVLEPLAKPVAEETPMFRALVHAAFTQRRKKLKNAWHKIAAPELLQSAAERAGIDLAARGETLSAEAFARMTRELENP
jgi:16S rRNA (adenine1518-N6/adenine1519-N6)-dimethyltransferase